jgi:methyl coenzyme M reductase subunit D
MGNLADHRRLREAQGLYKEDPGAGQYTKDELDYIPFLGNNPSDEKPAVYTARFNIRDGKIELEAKRSGGKLYITCLADEKHNRAIFECVERFVAAIFDGTAREIREAQPEDSELMKLKKQIDQLEKENIGHIETLEKLQDIMK